MLRRLDFAAGLGDLGFDDVNLVAHVDAVGHGFFVAVVADDIFSEKAVGAVIGGGSQANQAGVEVIEHLLPQVVDGAVAFVDEDEIEEFGGHLLGIDNRQGRFGLRQLGRVDLFGGFVEFGALEDGVKALDSADADLAIFGDVGGLQALDVVELGEFAVIVKRHIRHHFLLGLFAQVFGIHQKQDALGMGVFEQPVNGRNGGVGLASASGHLDERPGAVSLEGFFEVGDGGFLAIAQAKFFCRKVVWIEWRDVLQAPTQAVSLP